MSDIIQIATQKPVTKFIQDNLKDNIDGELVTFKYGGLYYTRFVILNSDDDNDETSKVYKTLLEHTRKHILKSWIFKREECKSLMLSNKKPFYRDEEGQVSISI